MQDKYPFKDHVHNYSVWTSARAVQRKFTNTQNIKYAIENSRLRDFSEIRRCDSAKDFEEFHRDCAHEIINSFDELKVANATYGRAAKIIAIYLKTASIIPLEGQGNFSQLIHPPIDRILLTNLSRKNKIKKLCERGWTSLNENEYWTLCERIELEGFALNWKLEEYWHPEQEILSEKS